MDEKERLQGEPLDEERLSAPGQLMEAEESPAVTEGTGGEDGENAGESNEETAVTQESGTADNEDVSAENGDGGKKKKRVGRYKYHIEASTYYNLLTELEVVNGREKKNRNIAMIFLVLALISALDAGLHPGNFLALLAAAVLIMVGFMVKNQGRKLAKRSVKAVPDGFSLAIEVSSKGLKVQQSGQNGTILPYEGVRMVYDHDGYLYVVTGDRTAMFIPKDRENRNYLAIEQKLREIKKDKYKVV